MKMKKGMVFMVVVLLHYCLQLQMGLVYAAPEEEHPPPPTPVTLTFHFRISTSAPPGGVENPRVNLTLEMVNMTLSFNKNGGGFGDGGCSRRGFWSGLFYRRDYTGFASATRRSTKANNATDADDGQYSSGSNGRFASVTLIGTLIAIVGILSIV